MEQVVCIGAGYAGIVAGIRFRQRISNIDLTIYEKENGVGGTWYVNRYPVSHNTSCILCVTEHLRINRVYIATFPAIRISSPSNLTWVICDLLYLTS